MQRILTYLKIAKNINVIKETKNASKKRYRKNKENKQGNYRKNEVL